MGDPPRSSPKFRELAKIVMPSCQPYLGRKTATCQTCQARQVGVKRVCETYLRKEDIYG